MSSKELMEIDVLLNHFLTYSKGKLKWKLETIPEEYLTKSAEELEASQKLTETDKKLRLALHRELKRASGNSEKIVMSNVSKGICHANSLLEKLDSPEKLAWYVLPYQDEEIRITHQVNEANDAIEALLHIDIYNRDERGRNIGLNHKAAELKYKAAKLIYDRAYPATQKIAYLNDSKDNGSNKAVEDLDKKIKQLEESLKK